MNTRNLLTIGVILAIMTVPVSFLIGCLSPESSRPTETLEAGADGESNTPDGNNIAINETEPEPEISLPRLLDLGSVNCVPCKRMAPFLEELRTEYEGQMAVEFIDVRINQQAGRDHGIRAIPTQIFFDEDGNELFRHIGFFSKEDILAKWIELGFEFRNLDSEFH